MNKSKTNIFLFIEQALPWVVLVIILLYTCVKFFEAPYIGFRWASSGEVAFLFTQGDNQTSLRVGDQLLQADSVTWSEYKQNLTRVFIQHTQPAQVIQLRIERDGKELTIPWVPPGPNPGEISDRFWNEGLLGFAPSNPQPTPFKVSLNVIYSANECRTDG